MGSFDKKIKNLAKDFKTPDTYNKKVDEIIESIQQDNVSAPKKKTFVKLVTAAAAFCIVIAGYLLFSNAQQAEASFLDTFKHTILDFLGIDKEQTQEIGVDSHKKEAVSKPDLLMELQEVVMDSQSIYAIVKITAPANIEFNENTTFDYFGFCEGSNYNASSLVPGIRGCKVLEILKEKKNIATFLVDVSTGEQIREDREVTVFMKDLIAEPYENVPDILVEGMWSLTFMSSYTSTDNITVKGTPDMTFSLLGETVSVKKLRLLPLGMTVIVDVTAIPVDILNTSDTKVYIRLKMLDGSEVLVADYEEHTKSLSSNVSIGQYSKNKKVFEKHVFQFDKAININQVVGAYVEDCYIPLKEYE